MTLGEAPLYNEFSLRSLTRQSYIVSRLLLGALPASLSAVARLFSSSDAALRRPVASDPSDAFSPACLLDPSLDPSQSESDDGPQSTADEIDERASVCDTTSNEPSDEIGDPDPAEPPSLLGSALDLDALDSSPSPSIDSFETSSADAASPSSSTAGSPPPPPPDWSSTRTRSKG